MLFCIFYITIKSETGRLNEISGTDITISLVREEKPRKLLKQLSTEYKVKEDGKSIYRFKGLFFPLQILVTKELDSTLHGWLCSLTRSIKQQRAENLLSDYSNLGNGRDKQNASVIIDFVSNVNVGVFLQILKENDHMTEAMKELIAPEIIELRLMLNSKDKELANNKKKLANKNKELANKNKELANKDEEIERLKRQLQEAQQRK